MPKLRYKEEKKEKKKHKHKKYKNDKPYKPPTLYEEEPGWIPSRNENEAWREHLFEAMMEDEGQDPFYTHYTQPTPQDTMTDEEYRRHIVDGMYRRTHKEEIEAEERRARKKKEKEDARAKIQREHEERVRLDNIKRELGRLQNNEKKLQQYYEQWKQLEETDKAICKLQDIPWPTSSSISIENVKSFLTNDKKTIRKEQTRYHPDKFIARYLNNRRYKGTEKEKQRILIQINEVSGYLNEIMAHISRYGRDHHPRQ